MPPRDAAAEHEFHSQRIELLEQINGVLERPMIALAFAWLVLLVVDFTSGLSQPLEIAVYVIWGLFILDFIIEITIAPDKWAYLRGNWLTAIALAVPALRVFAVLRALRALRAARAVRSLSLVRITTSFNRGMRAVRGVFGARGIAYVFSLTAIVIFVGSAGMLLFERGVDSADGAGIDNYGDALWWTAMAMTTMGSDYFPRTAEGRILGWLLAVYAFAIFGYITATIASLFVRQDTERDVRSAASERERRLEQRIDELLARLDELSVTRERRPTSPRHSRERLR